MEKFIKYNFSSFINNDIYDNINSQLDRHIKSSNYKMRLYVSNINNIITIDTRDGSMFNSYVYKKNRGAKCLFKMFILKTEMDLYLINELCGIMYL